MPAGVTAHRGVRIALGVAGGVVLLLVIAQLLLPSLAAKRVRERLARYGTVKSASVSAFPAVELLWGKADSASVRAGALSMTPPQIGSLLWEGRQVSSTTFTA